MTASPKRQGDARKCDPARSRCGVRGSRASARARGVPSRRRCVAAAGSGVGVGRGRRATKGTPAPLHVTPTETQPTSRVSTPSPLHCLFCPLRVPTPYTTVSGGTSSPTDPPLRRKEETSALAPAGPGLGAGWAMQAETSGSWGRVSPHSPTRGGELGEGAGQGRKRAGAVFVAAPPSGTDGWGEERVRGERRRGAGAADEEPRISTPQISREKPPSPSHPRKERGRQRRPFSRRALAYGLRQTPHHSRPLRGAPLNP